MDNTEDEIRFSLGLLFDFHSFQKGVKVLCHDENRGHILVFSPFVFFKNFKVNGFSNSRHDMERTGIMLKTENEPMRR